MPDLSTRYLGLDLKNPIIVSSSGLTQTVEGVRRCEAAGAGAVVLKSIFEEQIASQVDELLASSAEVPWQVEADEYLSRYGRESAVDEYLQLIRATKKAASIPVIASINCVTAGGWMDFASKIERAGADALELNIFVLPSDHRQDGAVNEKLYFDVARTVSKSLQIPVALKVGPYFSGLAHTLADLSRTGIKGLVLFNRFFRIDFDIETLSVVPGDLLSTPEESLTPLRWISILCGRVQCDLAATTGIHHGDGVIKQILAGAAAVQICSVLYRKNPDHIGVMLTQMDDWMKRHEFATIHDFQGKLSQGRTGNPAAYERVQFMKGTADFE